MDNGLTVIHQAITTTPVATVDVWVKAGAIHEPSQWSGMAHFLEHMIFKGTEHLPPGQFDQVVESRGGVTNAATSHDFAHFYITIAAKDLPDTLPYLAELLLHAAIPEAEFLLEREVVLEEIRQAQDDPDWLGFQALVTNAYHHHPYRRPVLGTPLHLLQQTDADMRRFHHAYYQPDNMTVVITGGVTEAIALDLVQRAFSQFPDRVDLPQDAIKPEPLIQELRREELVLPRLEQARLLMSWIGPGMGQLQDAYGLDLLSSLLSDGRTSRLIRDLREEQQLVQDISCQLSLQRDSSLFTIAAWLDVEDLEAVESRIQEHLSQLVAEPVTQAELARCQRMLCNQYAFSIETPSDLAGLYGYYSTVSRPELAVAYPTLIRSLHVADLQRLAQHYLSPQHYAVTVLKPE